MLTGQRVACLSSLGWSDRPTSRHHLARVLARTNEVLFVDPPASLVRTHRLHRGRVHTTDVRNLERLEPPPHLPARSLAFAPVLRVERARYERAVARVLERRGSSVPILWNVSPLDFSARIADRVRPALHVLHFTDAFWDYPRWGALQERALADVRRTAAVAVATTTAIADGLQARGFDPHVVGHGVDVDHFAPVAERTIAPTAALTGLRPPVVGFVGRLDRRLDVEVVVALAREATVVLVGPSVLPDATARRLQDAGCVLAGGVGYDDIPTWLAGFDVAVLPYVPVPSVQASHPLKLLEYLAAGLPVVATDIGATRELGDAVTRARDADGFVSAVRSIWSARAVLLDDAGARRARVDVARPQSWERRAEELSTLVEAALQSAALPR